MSFTKTVQFLVCFR